ncbi:hypothetical protein RHSIM_RhsimUnG0052800 [Rhododendron simsii]|uniref:Uncharacterized protein n=1 Tax=Rhododendron simsii TaxID=118357 RepID=A0A834FWL6_RHOSS|nr:hypothetical protein RHSIM_RhsimUnG0052800 [Rhododendron simsii]
MRHTRRDVSAIKRGMLWIAARCGREGDVYVPTEADMRESTPEESEVVHKAVTSGSGESSAQRVIFLEPRQLDSDIQNMLLKAIEES